MTQLWLNGQGQSMKMPWDALGPVSGVSEHGVLMEPKLELRAVVTPCLSRCYIALRRHHDKDAS